MEGLEKVNEVNEVIPALPGALQPEPGLTCRVREVTRRE